MSTISSAYSARPSFSYTQPTLLPPPPADTKQVAVTESSPGIVPFPDIDILIKSKQQAAEDQARIDAQRLSGKAGVQTDGNIYWVNGKKDNPLIEVEDYVACDVDDLTQSAGKNVYSFGSGGSEQEIATTTAHGTRVSIQSLPTNQLLGTQGSDVKLLNIETSGGLQIQMGLDQNVRINDTEDGGVSLFFPDTGETKRFDANGNVTTEAGEQSDILEGGSGDDILVNINKSAVDAGEGNDTVFNFSKNTVIQGGGGDDKVFLPGHAENVIINTGKGNNSVHGGQVNKAIINAQGDDDKIYAYALHGTNITGTGKLAVEAKTFSDSNLQSAGDLSAKIGWVSDTRIQVGKANDQSSNPSDSYARLQAKANLVISTLTDSFIQTGNGNSSITINSASDSSISTGGNGNSSIAINGASDSSISTGGNGNSSIAINGASDSSISTGGNGNSSITINSASDSSISGGGGNDTIIIRSANKSSISTSGGNDTLRIRHSDGSTIDMGDGNDTLVAIGVLGSKISMGNGDDTLVVNSVGGTTLDTGEGNDKLYYGGGMDGIRLGIDVTKDNLYHGGTGFVYNYFENPSQANWDKMILPSERYEKTHLFKNYSGEEISILFGSHIQSSRTPSFSRKV